MDEYFNALQNQIAQNNAWSAEQAQKQMDFQERMSNTSHQREIEDLKAAGLNPVLSARLGGASTPSGAMSTADPSGTAAMASLMSQMIQSQGDTARTALRVASGSGYGYGSGAGSSAFTIGTKENTTFINGLLQMLGMGLPSDAKKGVQFLYDNAEQIADALGLPEDNGDGKTSFKEFLRDYLTGKWTLQDTIDAVKGFFKDIDDKAGANMAAMNETMDSNWNTIKDVASNIGESIKEKAENVVNAVKDVITNVGNKVSNIVNNSSQLSKDSFQKKVTNTKAKLTKSKI